MFISIKLANEIMREISTIMPYYSNIMDEMGTILTCTDSVRVGTKHEGAQIILNNKLNELIVERENQYAGCRMGILLPIHLGIDIIGFFGIAGKPTEISNYAKIIQKMVEMIVYSKFEESHRQEVEQSKLFFIDLLVHGNANNSIFNVEEMMSQYGLNKLGPFSLGFIKHPFDSFISSEKNFSNTRHRLIFNSVTTILDNNLILAANKKNYSVFISNYSINNLQNILSELFTSIQDQYDFSLFGVIGSPCKDYIEIPKHYKEAQSMFYYLDSQKKIGIHHYNPANLNFIIDSMSETHRENLNTKVFHMCNVSEVLEYKSFIIEYYKCNGSLKHLSQENFIHKNTVQYKIQKVLSKTGFDMRVTNNLFILYIASIT